MGIKNHLDEERKTNLLIRLGFEAVSILLLWKCQALCGSTGTKTQ